MQVAKLSADLYANTSRFESGLKRASGKLGGFSRGVEKSMGRSARSFDNFNARALRTNKTFSAIKSQALGLGAILAGSFSVTSLVRLSDTLVGIDTRLGNVTRSASDLETKYKQLFDVSQNLGTSLESNVDAFVKLNTSLPDAVRETRDLVAVTELLSRGFAASGTEAAAQRGALIQLTQGLASNFQSSAQEINSLIDAAPLLAKTIAEQLGGNAATDLKKFAREGKLTTESFLDALEASRGAIESFEIPKTIQQATTRLRNNFLDLTRESGALNDAGRTLAQGINLIADNLGTLAQAVKIAGVALVGKFILAPAIAAVSALGAGVLATSAALVGMSGTGVIGAAIVATTALSKSLAILTKSFALLGGPIGVALIGTYFLMGDAANRAKDAQEVLNAEMLKAKDALDSYSTASADTRRQIELDTASRIESYTNELVVLNQIAEALRSENFVFRGARGLGSKLGIDTSAKNVEELAANTKAAIDKLREQQALLREQRGAAQTSEATSGADASSGSSDFEKVLNNLKKESTQIDLQSRLYGKKEGAIDAALRKLEIEQQLSEQGIEITAEQSRLLDQYINKIETQKDALSGLQDETKNLDGAYKDLGLTFNSALEDALVEGKKFSDVLKSLAQDIQRIIVRRTITEPLGAGLSNFAATIGDSLFGGRSIGSNATGLAYVPRDMTTRVHKGEAIIPSQQASKMGGMNVSIVNNSPSAEVQAQQVKTPSGMELRVMIEDIVAQGVQDTRSPINRSIGGAFGTNSVLAGR